MRRRRALGVLGIGALVALVSCGISAEPEATRIEPDQVPFGLLDAEPSTTISKDGRVVSIHLLTGDRLLVVDRTMPDDGSLADLLELVIGGPTAEERGLGITSAVPPGTIAGVETSRGTAEVDLTPAFGDLRSADQILALAQIVYTLTAQPGIGSVAFTLEGEPIEVPRSDGTVSDDPLSRDDFSALAPD